MKPEEAACEGVFLAFQYPVEIPGIGNAYFLRSAMNAIRKYRGQDELDAMDFLPLYKERMKLLEMDDKLMNRSVNEGFSGGEKKRNEILQLAMLEPKLAILDETDSGLDIDALRIVAQGVNAMRSPDRAFLVITHYQRLLDYITPDFVHVLVDGKIVRSGGPELALELEEKGYGAAEASVPAGFARMSTAARVSTVTKDTENENTMATEAGKLNAYLEAFGELTAERQERDPLWLRQLREDAWQRFNAKGFPTTHDEDWRFTNLAALAKTPFRRAAKGNAAVTAAQIETFACRARPASSSSSMATLRRSFPKSATCPNAGDLLA